MKNPRQVDKRKKKFIYNQLQLCENLRHEDRQIRKEGQKKRRNESYLVYNIHR